MANGLSSGQKPTGVADLDSSQTLQNKTLDASNAINGAPVTGSDVINPSRLDVKKDTQANLVTYASTASNGQIVYATDSKKMFQVQESALAEIGSGAGGINYISNPDFEVNADGWTGDTNLTIARSAVSPLRGDASGVVSKSAINANGQSVKIPFTIDAADLAKKLYISLDKDASDANYADADLRLEIIKDPNGTPVTIRCNAEDLLGGKGSHLAWFQSDAAILEYELVIKCNSVNALAYSVKIDNVSVGPREVSYGGAMTDWQSYTPTFTGFGTVSVSDFKYRRVGDTLFINGTFTSGTTTAVEPRISFPNGVVAQSNLSALSSRGIYLRNSANAAASFKGGNLFTEPSIGYLTFGRLEIFSGTNINWDNKVSSSSTNYAANDEFHIELAVPIQGWSSNSVQSEDIGNREIRVQGRGNGGTSVTANVTNITFTETEDTSASWDGSIFTAPETGDYNFSGIIRFTTSTLRELYFYIDGASNKLIGTNSLDRIPFSVTVRLNKGQTGSIRVDTTSTLSNTAIVHNIHIQKLAQPQTILETETVAARYTSNSGQSVIIAGTDVVFEDKVNDTHGAYNASTGIYTIPVKGDYNIEAIVSTTATVFAASTGISLSVYIDGVEVAETLTYGNGANILLSPRIFTTINLSKGQQVKIVAAETNITLSSVGYRNVFSIARIK